MFVKASRQRFIDYIAKIVVRHEVKRATQHFYQIEKVISINNHM